MRSWLIKRRSLLLDGLKDSSDTNSIISFDNMSLLVGQADPENVVIPSVEEVIRINAEIADTQFNIQYTFEYEATDYPFANTLPTSAELNTLYGSTGIPVKTLTGLDVLLGRSVGIQAGEGEGISVVSLTTSIFEVAGFQADQWLISGLKNDIPSIIAALDARITINEIDVQDLDNKIVTLTAEGLTTNNDKDITGYGALPTDGSIIEGGKLVRRDEVISGLSSLKQEADANKVEADATKVVADNVSAQVAINTPKITDNETHAAINTQHIGINTTNIQHNTTQSGANTINIFKNQTDIATNLANRNADKIVIDNNVAGVTDYVNNKADFLRLEDVTGATEVDFVTPIKFMEDGDDAVAHLINLPSSESNLIDTFVDGRLVTIQATPTQASGFPVEYARDSWNNGTATSNIILGRDVKVLSTWTSTTVEIRVSGLTNPDRTNFIRDFTITFLSQLGGSAGAGVDSIARTDATAALATATQANTTAKAAEHLAIDNTKLINFNQGGIHSNTTNITKNATDIAANLVKINTNITSIGTINTKVTGLSTTLISHNTKINANTAAVKGKQNIIDNSLTTSTKSIVGSINELKTRIDTGDSNIAVLGAKKVSGGSLLSTAETLATEEKLGNQVKYYQNEIILFNGSNVTNGKFGDSTLFKTIDLLTGGALLGSAHSGDTIKVDGNVQAHTHYTNIKSSSGDTGAYISPTMRSATGSYANWSVPDDGGALFESVTGEVVGSHGVSNNARGVEMVYLCYIALKDVTFEEMGLV